MSVPVKNRAHSSTVGTASMHVEASSQQDTIFYCDGAMWKRSNKQLVPTWEQQQAHRVKKQTKNNKSNTAGNVIN